MPGMESVAVEWKVSVPFWVLIASTPGTLAEFRRVAARGIIQRTDTFHGQRRAELSGNRIRDVEPVQLY